MSDPRFEHPEFKFLEGMKLPRKLLMTPGLVLVLDFHQNSGSWAHYLAVGDGPWNLREGLAATVEGRPGVDDPARVVSPVYQDIQNHPVQDGLCVLLTGQSTPHHFSAVVTARRDGPSMVVEVDVADRCRGPIEVLAATYLVQLGSGDLLDASPERVVWGGDALGCGRLEFTTRGVDDVALAEAGRRATRVQALARLVPSTHTQRLFYAWRWTPAARPQGAETH